MTTAYHQTASFFSIRVHYKQDLWQYTWVYLAKMVFTLSVVQKKKEDKSLPLGSWAEY